MIKQHSCLTNSLLLFCFCVLYSSASYAQLDSLEQIIDSVPNTISERYKAEDIIKGHIKAMGGERNLKNVKTLSLKMSTTVQGVDRQYHIVKHYQPPDKLYKIIYSEYDTLEVKIFDGKQLYIKQPQGESLLTYGSDFDAMSFDAMLFPELYYEKYDYRLKVDTIVRFGDYDAFRIEFIAPSGFYLYNYYDFTSTRYIGQSRSIASSRGKIESNILVSIRPEALLEQKGISFSNFHVHRIGENIMFFMNVHTIEVNEKLPRNIFKIDYEAPPTNNH